MNDSQARAVELLAAGKSVAEVAEEVGKSTSTVRRWMKSLADAIARETVIAGVVKDLPGQKRLKALYTNDRRAGKTHPEKVEIIQLDDPRHRNFPNPKGYASNRADLRRRGFHGRTNGPRSYPDAKHGGTKLAGALR